MHKVRLMRTDLGRLASSWALRAVKACKLSQQHFGGDILHDRLLRQARGMPQIEVMLEPLDRLFDAPALVIRVTERTSRKMRHIQQVGHKYPRLPVGRDVANQSHGLRLAWAFKIENIAQISSTQRDHMLQKPTAQEVAHASEARVAGLFDPHAKRDCTLIQRRHQPATGVTSIQEQQVGTGEAIKMLEQHLAFAFVDAVQRGRKYQFAARQEQTKKDLIGQRGALDVAGAQTETHGGGIGRNQSQTVPERHKPIVPGMLDEPVVEQRDGSQRQLGTGLGERLLRDLAHQLRSVFQVGKELVEFALMFLRMPLSISATRWQRQFALAGESGWMIEMGCVHEKFGRAQMRRKIDKKRVKRHVGQ
jgi:hypothetical protein